MTKKFFYVCAGLLCLAAAYHLGARTARAQATGPVVGFTATGGHCVRDDPEWRRPRANIRPQLPRNPLLDRLSAADRQLLGSLTNTHLEVVMQKAKAFFSTWERVGNIFTP